MERVTYQAIIEEEGYTSNHKTEEAAIVDLEAAKTRFGRDEPHVGYVAMYVKSGLHRSRTVVYPTPGRTWSN